MRACTPPSLPLSTPGEGEAGRRGEGECSGGGVDRLSCWVGTLLFPLPPWVGGGGAASRGGARVQPLATGGEVLAPWWSAAN